MNIIKWGLIGTGAVVALGFIGFQAYWYFESDNTEQRPYTEIKQIGDIEIRFYPEATLASVIMDGDMRKAGNSGFRELAGYIFGGNKKKESIAMTAPVVMDRQQDASMKMSFIMPGDKVAKGLPQPNSQKILMEKADAHFAAVIRTGGYADEAKLQTLGEQLTELLEKEGIAYDENFEYLYYNPPFQLIGRRNEVLVRLPGFKG